MALRENLPKRCGKRKERGAGRGRKEVREEEGKRATKRGETGADDAEVRFDDGPFGRFDAVPGDVEVRGCDVKGCDAEDRCDADTFWGGGLGN